MHLRRIAPLLADLFARHGLAVQADASLTGPRGAPHAVPLACRDADGRLLLVDGDVTGAPVDNVALHPLLSACLDLGCAGLYVHDGPVSAAAVLAVGDRVGLLHTDAFATLLGQTALADALGEPLPAMARPRSFTPALPMEPTLAASAREDLEESWAAPLVEAAVAPSAPLADPDPEPLVVDLPPEAAALGEHVIDLAEAEVAQAAAQPYIQLADETPVLHLEEAAGTVAEVAPAPASATEAPDVIPLAEAQPAPPAPVVPVDPAEFAVPTVNDLMPPAFREVPTPLAPPAPTSTPAPTAPAAARAEPVSPALRLELPPAFADDGGARIQAPEGSRGLLPPRVTLAEAKRSVADRLFSIEEAELILQPVHLFDYAVDVLRPGKLTADPIMGRVQVNGTDRRVTPTDPAKCDPTLPPRVFASDDLTVMDKVLRVGPERAEQLAAAWATQQHAKTVDVTTDRADDSFLVVERKSVGPTSGQVRLTPLGLWHRPFWRLWGGNGHVDLDAVDGQVLDEEIKTPNPDFLVVE